MTFSYDVTKLSDELNKIRLYIGDTDSSDPLLEDEEIELVQVDSTSFLKRVSVCCHLICSKLAKRVDYRLSLLTEKASVLYDRYKVMAKRYEVMSSLSYPWAGSVLKSFKEATEDDTTLVKPKFKVGLHDHD